MQSLHTVDFTPPAHPSAGKGIRSTLAHLQIAKSFVAMLLGDESLDTIGELINGLLNTAAYNPTVRHLNQDPTCAALIQERYIPPAHDLDALIAYPSESLGYIYASYMKKTGFNPNLHAGMEPVSDAHYIELRLSQTHDLWHVLTGFDTSPMGEIGLQAFHLPQFPYPLATLLIANSLISSTLMEPNLLPELIEAIAQGFQMGKAAKPLFSQRWEDHWEKPLSQWQRELNIHPIQQGWSPL